MLHDWWWTVGDIFCKQAPTATSIEGLLGLIGTPITICEKYFHSNANCIEIFLFLQNSKMDLSLLDIIAIWKQHLNYSLSSFWKELV